MEEEGKDQVTIPNALRALGSVLVAGAAALATQLVPPSAVKLLAQVAPPLIFVDVTAQTGLPELVAKWKAERVAAGDTRWWPTAITAGDFRGTGQLDLVFSHHGAPGTRIYTLVSKSGATPVFEDHTEARTLSGSFGAIGGDGSTYIFDANDDGAPDITAITDEVLPQTAFNDGAGNFTIKRTPFMDGQSQQAFKFAMARLSDVNGDDRIDVEGLVPFRVMLNRGGGVYEAAKAAPGTTYLDLTPDMIVPGMPAIDVQRKWYYARHLDIGAGHGQVIIATFGSGTRPQQLFVIRRDPSGAYVDVTAALGLPAAGRVSGVYDINRDGLPDLLVTASPQSGVYLNQQGRFERVVDALAADLSTTPLDSATTLDSLADFDEDGRPELLTVTFRYGRQSRLYQDVGGSFARAPVNLVGSWQYVVADLDGDGRLDIVAGSKVGLTVFLNRTPALGNFMNVRLRNGADALVEAYSPAGRLLARVRNNTPGIPALLSVCGIGHSHGGNLPIHLGLGWADTIILRVTFPGGRVVTLTNVKTNQTVSM